jgi:hypothetical protein
MPVFRAAVTWDPGKSPWIGAASFIPEPSTTITRPSGAFALGGLFIYSKGELS